MSSTYETKKEILKLFTNGIPLTLTEISDKLDLAPSTVSQHLNELKLHGAIQEVDRQGTKKWKYYKMNLEKAEELYIKWSVRPAGSSSYSQSISLYEMRQLNYGKGRITSTPGMP